MALSYVEGRWGIDWSPALIFPQFSDDTFVQMTARVPARGNIYDRNGLGLAVQGELVEIGVVPGKIQDEANLLSQLSSYHGPADRRSPGDVRRRPGRLVRAAWPGRRRDRPGLLRHPHLPAGGRAARSVDPLLPPRDHRSPRRRRRRPHPRGGSGGVARPGLHRRRDGGPDGAGNVGRALPVG